MTETLKSMKSFLIKNNYDIQTLDNFMSVVKHSDDQWNHFNKFFAEPDGVYLFTEVQMSTYDKKKQISCNDFETSCFLVLAWFVLKELKPDKDVFLLSEIKKHISKVAKNSEDCENSRSLLNKIITSLK